MRSRNPAMVRGANRKGFTLVELLVVLAIIGITSAIAAPGISAWVQNYRAKAIARQLMTDLMSARATAVSRPGDTVTVRIEVANNRYMMQVDGATVGLVRRIGAPTIGDDQSNPYYAAGVALGANSAPNDLVITFDSLGNATFSAAGANGTARVTVTQGDAAPWNVTVNRMGSVQISGGPQFAL